MARLSRSYNPKKSEANDVTELQRIIAERTLLYDASHQNLLELRNRASTKRNIYQQLTDPNAYFSGETLLRISAILPSVKSLWKNALSLIANLDDAKVALSAQTDLARITKTRAILFGASISVGEKPVALNLRSFGESDTVSTLSTPEQVYKRLEKIYNGLRDLICEIETADNSLPEVAQALRLQSLEQLKDAELMGSSTRPTTASLHSEIERLIAEADRDPIGSFQSLNAMSKSLEQSAAAARALASFRARSPELIAQTRQALASLLTLSDNVQRCTQACQRLCSEIDILESLPEEYLKSLTDSLAQLASACEANDIGANGSGAELESQLAELAATIDSLTVQQESALAHNAAIIAQRRAWQTELPEWVTLSIDYGVHHRLNDLFEYAQGLANRLPTPMQTTAQTLAVLQQELEAALSEQAQ